MAAWASWRKPAQRNTFAMRASSPSEGTNGVQSNDLLMRKLQMSGGEAVWDLLAELKRSSRRSKPRTIRRSAPRGAKLRDAVDSVERSSKWLLEKIATSPAEALAGATSYLRLFSTTLGGCSLAKKRWRHAPMRRIRTTCNATSRWRVSLRRISRCNRVLSNARSWTPPATTGADIVLTG
jgi:butyryl-CoA dehydrogenase